MAVALGITQKVIPYWHFVPHGDMPGTRASAFVRELPLATAYQLLKSGHAVAVDTRRIEDYQREHIAGALHLTSLVDTDERRTTIFYGYSADITYALAQANQRDASGGNIYVLAGGFQQWKALDLKRDSPVTN